MLVDSLHPFLATKGSTVSLLLSGWKKTTRQSRKSREKTELKLVSQRPTRATPHKQKFRSYHVPSLPFSAGPHKKGDDRNTTSILHGSCRSASLEQRLVNGPPPWTLLPFPSILVRPQCLLTFHPQPNGSVSTTGALAPTNLWWSEDSLGFLCSPPSCPDRFGFLLCP